MAWQFSFPSRTNCTPVAAPAFSVSGRAPAAASILLRRAGHGFVETGPSFRLEKDCCVSSLSRCRVFLKPTGPFGEGLSWFPLPPSRVFAVKALAHDPRRHEHHGGF